MKYLLSGLSAVNFEPPEKNILFVEEAQNSTNKTTGESSSFRHFTLPVGCHKLELGKCPRGSDVIVSSSTSSWKVRGLMTYNRWCCDVRSWQDGLAVVLAWCKY